MIKKIFYKIYGSKLFKKLRWSDFFIENIKPHIRKLMTLGAEKYPYPDKTVLDYDWDYLIVIDACRHDLFEEVYGETDYIISQGSSTMEWRNKTFRDKEYDMVFVSGNPHMSKVEMEEEIGRMPFSHIEKVYDYGWGEELKTVPPEEVTKAALRCTEKWPDRKMIVHYMQPHHPFIGDKEIIGAGWKGLREKENGKTIWNMFREGKIDKKKIWEAYKGNLKLVMKEVEKLKEGLNGRIILTSDHGNLMGKYGLYAHPTGLRVKELVKVPFVVLKKGKEGEIDNIRI